MKTYIGNKRIQAEPQQMPSQPAKLGEQPTEFRDGYKVVYEDGYESWSPKEVFDKAYREAGKLTFSEALELLKRGKKVARSGWNGKGMFVYLVNGCQLEKQLLRGEAKENLKDVLVPEVKICSHIDMKAADNSIVVGWLASQTDLLAEDWQEVE